MVAIKAKLNFYILSAYWFVEATEDG